MRDRLAEYVAELDELERQQTGEMIALEQQLVIVDAELAKLPENQEKVLRLRYVEGLYWTRIALITNYIEKYVFKIAKTTTSTKVDKQNEVVYIDTKNDRGIAILKNNVLEAVHDDDLEKLLESLGMLDAFNNGTLACSFCHEIITKRNLSSIFPSEDAIAFCCDNPSCIALLLSEDQSI